MWQTVSKTFTNFNAAFSILSCEKEQFGKALKIKIHNIQPTLPDLGPRVHVHPLQGDAADVEDPKHAAHPHELVHQGRQFPSLYLKNTFKISEISSTITHDNKQPYPVKQKGPIGNSVD